MLMKLTWNLVCRRAARCNGLMYYLYEYRIIKESNTVVYSFKKSKTGSYVTNFHICSCGTYFNPPVIEIGVNEVIARGTISSRISEHIGFRVEESEDNWRQLLAHLHLTARVGKAEIKHIFELLIRAYETNFGQNNYGNRISCDGVEA